MSTPRRRTPIRHLVVLLALLMTLVVGGSAMTMSAASAGRPTGPKPTIVFVHGAFADASGFNAEIQALQSRGYIAYAVANPLRGLANDSAYLKDFLSTINGPVVLVGHSYGGAVITNAATGNPNVKALVYIAAFALDEGETGGQAIALGGGSSDLMANLVLRPYPGAPVINFPNPGDLDQDGYINPATFRQVFAADVPAEQAAVMAAAQRPGTLSSLGVPSGVPAWKTIPSWYLVATQDHAIPAQAERVMAKRAGAHTVEVDSSHVAMISHPRAVTALILAAAASS
jgi:pimeloyl-ACP methyl ester carboxylesterase